MSLGELLNAANQLSKTNLETLVNGILLLYARRKVPILPSQEASRLVQINQGIPPMCTSATITCWVALVNMRISQLTHPSSARKKQNCRCQSATTYLASKSAT